MDLGLRVLVLVSFAVLMMPVLAQSGYSQGTSGLEIVAYPSRIAYLNAEEIQVNYLVYFQNGEPAYGGSGLWQLQYFYNGTVICEGNFTLPSGMIGISPQKYKLGTDRYSMSVTYAIGNMSTSTRLDFFVVNYTEFHYSLYVAPLVDDYVKLIIDDNVEYLVGGIYLNIPVPDLTVDFISLHSHNQEIMNISHPLNLNMYGMGEYYLPLPENVSVARIFVSVAHKIMNITYSRETSLHFYYTDLSGPPLAGGYLNLSVKSVEQHNEPLYYHFEILDKNDLLLYHSWGNHSGISYRIPENYAGTLRVRCEIFNATGRIYTLDSVYDVKYALLDVYFDKYNYAPGSSFYVLVNFRSYVIKNVTFLYNVMGMLGSGYVTLYTRETADRKLEIKVPEEPPSSYRIEVYAISSRYSAFSAAEIHIFQGVELELKVLTESSYVTHVYTPGQIVEIRYHLSHSVEGGRLLYGFGDEFYKNPKVIFLGNECDGTVQIRIPGETYTGIYEVHFLLRYDGGEVERTILINVDRNPSWTFYNIIGMPLGHFVLLLIFLVVVVLLIFLRISEKNVREMKKRHRKKEKKVEQKEENSEKTEKDGEKKDS